VGPRFRRRTLRYDEGGAPEYAADAQKEKAEADVQNAQAAKAVGLG